MWAIFTEKTVQWHNHGVISNPLPPLPFVKIHSTVDFKSVALEEVISVTIAGQMMTMSGWLSMNFRVPHHSLDYKNYTKENMFLGTSMDQSRCILQRSVNKTLHRSHLPCHTVPYHTSTGTDTKMYNSLFCCAVITTHDSSKRGWKMSELYMKKKWVSVLHFKLHFVTAE